MRTMMVICLATTILTACQASPGSFDTPKPLTVTTRDGKTVDCIVIYGTGLSCDWDHARESP